MSKVAEEAEGRYLRLTDYGAVLVKFLTGRAKRDRDRIIRNRSKGVVSFEP
jgi:hypothetical protein